jgi:hypothetical protein
VGAFIPDFCKRSLSDSNGNDVSAKFVPGEGTVECFDLGASKSDSKDDGEFWLVVVSGGESRGLLRFV